MNDAAAKDDICQQVMASYIQQLQRDAMRAKDIREGRIPAPDSQWGCLLYTSPSPRDLSTSRMPSSA